MQDMLYPLQKRTGETLGTWTVDSVASLGDEGTRRGGRHDTRAECTDNGHERYERRNACIPVSRRYSHSGPPRDDREQGRNGDPAFSRGSSGGEVLNSRHECE